MVICHCALEGAGLGYDKLYTYYIPRKMTVKPGCRVRVPFGRGNRQTVAVVMAVSPEEGPEGCKDVAEVLDGEPLLEPQLLELASWLRENTFCTYSEALRAMLPPGMGVKLKYVYALSSGSATGHGAVSPKLTAEQRQILSFLRENLSPMPPEKVLAGAGLEKRDWAVLEELCRMGLVEKMTKAVRRVGDEKSLMIRLREDILELASIEHPITAAQKRLAELLLDVRQGSLKEVCYFAGVSRSVADKLRNAGLVEYYRQEVYRRPGKQNVAKVRVAAIDSPGRASAVASVFGETDLLERGAGAAVEPRVGEIVVGDVRRHEGDAAGEQASVFCGVRRESHDLSCGQDGAFYGVGQRLSESQAQAYRGLCQLWRQRVFHRALLYGVTGSGKTEVFVRLLEEVLTSGEGAILLVPEIALTPQTVGRFTQYFGENVAVLHSGLSMGERLDEWKRVRRGLARLVVGTRSAVFAPVQKLRLIILDEEQESSYQSERSPRYHAKTVAAKRMATAGGLLLLASATPSMESYYYAEKGVYHKFTLESRYGGAKLPEVYILDMAARSPMEEGEGVSEDLRGHLELVLKRGEQAILLLNRRGYRATTRCALCGTVAQCPNCSVALTFHSVNGSLMCHYCGYAQPGTTPCDRCGKAYKQYSGLGIQKVQEELGRLLPAARVLRMDTDSTVSRYAYERQFGAFAAGEYDILLGTQMVAKGLDFPNVTLVGVLNADASLYVQDYRSSARAFNLFTQVVGRGGRGSKPAVAFLQTFTPDNRILELAACQDYRGFYEMEIESRRLHLYPPFCQMMAVTVSSPIQEKARKSAKVLTEEMARQAAGKYRDMPLRIIGPAFPPLSKLAGQHRSRILLKCRWDGQFRQYLWDCLLWAYHNPAFHEVRVTPEPF